MYNNEIKDKFVELRAAGKSFGDISRELGVVKSTLHRWEEERADDIARLRRIAWEETEAQIAFRLEEQLSGLACDITDFQTILNGVDRNKLSVRETLMLLRESRREYFRLRAMLMGTSQRTKRTRESTPEHPGTKSNETERSGHIVERRSRDTNDLQRSGSKSFDFCPPPESETSLNPQLSTRLKNPAKPCHFPAISMPFPCQNSGGP